MAALFDQPQIPLVELRDVKPDYLGPLLEEETREWQAALDWDFAPSASLVRRFVGMRALTGYALPGKTHAVGYAYHVLDEGKGLIGGLYVARDYRNTEHENALMSAVLESMWSVPGTRRVEAQLLMLGSPLNRPMPYPRWFEPFARKFLEARLDSIPERSSQPIPATIAGWQERYQEDAAWMIAQAYAGHIDSRINDQYRSVWGGRRFLANIVQYPGCGTFFAPASFVARARPRLTSGNELCGICLASLVNPGIGHITQLCVTPSHRGSGIGRELLRRSLLALAEHGCHKVSLTVTSSNAEAIRLYERFGFRRRRDFAAYVWEMR